MMEDKNWFFTLNDFPEGKMHKRISAWDFYGKIDFPTTLWISAISPTLILPFFSFPEEKTNIDSSKMCSGWGFHQLWYTNWPSREWGVLIVIHDHVWTRLTNAKRRQLNNSLFCLYIVRMQTNRQTNTIKKQTNNNFVYSVSTIY